MLTIAGGILLAVVIICIVVLVIAGIANAVGDLFDPYGQGRTREEWRRECAETARHARSLKKTQAERDELERWFRSIHRASMDDIWERKILWAYPDEVTLAGNVQPGT